MNATTESGKRPRAVFLDRDGTINREVDYLSQPEQLELLPGAAQAIALLNQAQIPVVVVTNQAGVARGFFTLEQVHAVHHRLDELLAADDAHIDHYYICPHHPTPGIALLPVECDCRKPKPGLLLQAARELNLDLSGSVMIGDKLVDIEAGRAAGCATILVRTGYGAEQEPQLDPARHRGTVVVDTLRAAVHTWLGRVGEQAVE